MKLLKITYLIPIILFCFSNTNLMAQAPEGINYQAVFRNSNGNIVAGQQLSCRVEIIQGNISGLLTYSEKHGPTTNQQGIANFIIGGGQPIQGVFADMDWGNGPYYMKLYVDFDGQGSLFQMQQYGVQQLISVPYALHAKVADSIAGGGGGSGGGTDDQNLSGANLNGTDLQIDIEDGNSVTVDLAPLQDGTGTDDQNLSGANLNGTELQIDIEDGNSVTVDLAPLQDGTGTDDQNLSGANLSGTELQIDIEDGNSVTVDLAPLQDGTGTDDQNLSGANLNGTELQIDIEDGNSATVDLAPLQDGTGTDDQNLSGANLNGTELQIDIEDGNSATVDLAPLQDGVDDADSDPTNELNSSIGINGTNLEITDNGGTLSVDLSPIDSDDQILTSAELNGSNLDITIENGNTVSADVSALYNEDYDWLKAQQMMEWPNSIDDNIYRMGKVGIGTYNLAGKFKIDMYDPWPGGGCEGCQTIDFRRLHPGLNGNTFGFTSISYNAEPTNANTGGYSMFNLYNANWGTHENRYFGLSFDGESGLYIRKEFNGDYNGYVGIGTTSPIRKLDIRESVDGTTDQENPGEANLLLLKNTGLIGNSNAYKTVSIAFSAVNTDAKIVAGNENPTGGEDGYLAFQTRKAESLNETMRINSDGNVGIGTSIPNATLEVAGSARVSNLSGIGNRMVIANSSGDLATQAIPINTDNQDLLFNPSNNELSITNGNTIDMSSLNDSKWSRDNSSSSIYPLNISDNVGIGNSDPSTALDVVGVIELSNVAPTDPGSDIVRLGDGGTQLQVQTNYGYTRIGPSNSSYAHFYTDRPKYFFDKRIILDEGILSSYNEDLSLQTSQTNRVTIKNATGNVGIGLTDPDSKLEVSGRIHSIHEEPGEANLWLERYTQTSGYGIFQNSVVGADVSNYLQDKLQIGPAFGMNWTTSQNKTLSVTASENASTTTYNYGTESLITSESPASSHYIYGISGRSYQNIANNSGTISTYGVRGEARGVDYSYSNAYGGYFIGRYSWNGPIGVYGSYTSGTNPDTGDGPYQGPPVSPGYAGYFSGSVYSSGSFTTSDEALKKNIRNMENALDIVQKIKIYQYEFKTNEYADMNLLKGSHYGVLSNEIESVLPDITRKFRRITEENNNNNNNVELYKAVNYGELTPIVIKSIQEQQLIIEGLKEQIRIQQSQLDALNRKVNVIMKD